MRARTITLLLGLVLASSPALASPDCEDRTPGIHITYGFQFGGAYTDDEQEVFDKMYLRQNGISARTAKRTAKGCLEVFRQDETGKFVTEYYDPRTYELKLNLN